MATASEVKQGLDDIAGAIRTERQALKRAQARVQAAKNALESLPTTYNDVVTTVQGFDGSDAFEVQAQADLSVLTSEFQALKAKATNANADLQAYDFST